MGTSLSASSSVSGGEDGADGGGVSAGGAGCCEGPAPWLELRLRRAGWLAELRLREARGCGLNSSWNAEGVLIACAEEVVGFELL